ncbi:MAG: hypothetical protein NT079_05425 [Candidatus Omnitrophica bacterium]|nr:hypothetical protein [Candidatus Omnitrophota bacterium]
MMIKLNQKDRTELVLTAILIVVFIGLLFLFLNKAKNFGPTGLRFTPKIFFAASQFQYDTERNKGTPFILEKAEGETISTERDPFAFGASENTQAVPGSGLFLKGIIRSEDNPSAVINDRVLVVGDEIDGFKVTQILNESVILANEKLTLTLKLNQ